MMMKNGAYLTGRILLGQMFLLAGINKMAAFGGTQAYMESMGVPGMLLIPVILLEVAGGLAVILGWQTRWASLALAGFTLIAAFIFHYDPANQMQMILFTKNLSITGGLILLAGAGAGVWSLDNRRVGQHGQIASV
ncbi:MAG TPA: DoxX family protein [Gammaproteobacteria bacterium]|nr:DoxX family protein [Gammaproteobacteria bacterium]